MSWKNKIWFFDTEVFQHRWLFNALSITGERVSFSNNFTGLRNWIDRTNPLLMGYNTKHYDKYIVKGILTGGTPEDIKLISDGIICKGINGWEIDMGWVALPNMVDLMLDLPTKPSLKMIEGNLKMSIEESSIPFDQKILTDSDWDEVVEYCWHDVESLVPLFEKRLDYLEAKETLANMITPPLDVEKALDMTNAKLSAKFLKAKYVERDDEREYVYPDNLKKELIPQEVFDFFGYFLNKDIPLYKVFKNRKEEDE